MMYNNCLALITNLLACQLQTHVFKRFLHRKCIGNFEVANLSAGGSHCSTLYSITSRILQASQIKIFCCVMTLLGVITLQTWHKRTIVLGMGKCLDICFYYISIKVGQLLQGLNACCFLLFYMVLLNSCDF